MFLKFFEYSNDILFTEWGEKFYSQRTLQISPFVMDIQLSEEQNKLKINTSITAQEDLQQNFTKNCNRYKYPTPKTYAGIGIGINIKYKLISGRSKIAEYTIPVTAPLAPTAL
mgnify:CR=1 FL=1